MEIKHFDSLTKLLATGGSRRRLIKGLAAFSLGAAAVRPFSGRAAYPASGCKMKSCPAKSTMVCYYDDKNKCLGCECWPVTVGGITGGGLVETDRGGEAHLSLLGTRLPHPDLPNVFQILGQLTWVDPTWEGAGLQISSVQINGYGPTETSAGARELHGWAAVSAVEGQVPFYLEAVVLGGPGSGLDTVHLIVGDSAIGTTEDGATPVPSGFSYEATGTLVSGGFSLLAASVSGVEGEEPSA